MSAPTITLTTPTSAHPTILHSSPTGTLHLVQSTVSGASTIPVTRTISGVLIDDSLSSYTFQASSFASDLVSILSAANSAHGPSGTFTLTPSTLPTYSPASYRTNAGSASSSGAGTSIMTVTTSDATTVAGVTTAITTASASGSGAASATPAPVATTAGESRAVGIAPVVVFVLVAAVVAGVALIL